MQAAVPDARIVADHFHLVRGANTALDAVRRHRQRAAARRRPKGVRGSGKGATWRPELYRARHRLLLGAVELAESVAGSPTGVTVRVEQSRIASCEVRFDENVDAWAGATAADWLDAVIEGDIGAVRSSGDRQLTGALLYALHERLFGVLMG